EPQPRHHRHRHTYMHTKQRQTDGGIAAIDHQDQRSYRRPAADLAQHLADPPHGRLMPLTGFLVRWLGRRQHGPKRPGPHPPPRPPPPPRPGHPPHAALPPPHKTNLSHFFFLTAPPPPPTPPFFFILPPPPPPGVTPAQKNARPPRRY